MVKDGLIASGTCLLMLRPANQHFLGGCGFQHPTYIAELSRVTHVVSEEWVSCATWLLYSNLLLGVMALGNLHYCLTATTRKRSERDVD